MSTEIQVPDKDEFKIGEVCEIAGVKPFVLRYWETEFTQLTPAKGAGGQRTYSRADVELILRIKRLLYEERFTVAGAKKRLTEEAEQSVARPKAKPAKLDSTGKDKVERARRAIGEVRQELAAVIESLK